MMIQKIYNVGIYTRLSQDDERAGESLSIENQKLLLTEYVKKQGWNIYDTYVDDGWSGTNFERPDFKRMLEDIRDGRLNLVIVKDLSRLGRDHVRVGEFTEDILPAFKCRFIALNDNIDTLDRDNSNNDMMGFRNLFNEFHSRDTSKKVRTVRRACAQRGQFLGTYAPYGYQRDPQNKHHLVPDQELAAVVRRIFQLRCEGMGIRAIACLLNEDQILPPREIYYARKNQKNPIATNRLWNDSTIKNILHGEVYIGNIVQGRAGTLSYKSRKIVQKPKEEWIRAEAMHEPIISLQTWNTVRAIEEKRYRPRKSKSGEPASIFSGVIRCADCGFSMRCQVEKGRRKNGSEYRYVCFLCGNYSRSGKMACTAHIIYENAINAIVLEDIRRIARFVACDKESAVAHILQVKNKQTSDRLAVYRGELRSCQSRLDELEHLIQCLYEDRVRGVVPDGIFKTLLSRYEQERTDKAEIVRTMQSKLESGSKDSDNVSAWADRIEQYVSLEKLEKEILLELVDRIEVGEAQKIEGKRLCDVKVIYRFFGELSVIPEMEDIRYDKAV